MHRPGDVLAGRYRLADLLSETDHGRFWLAHDSVLGRPVAVHVIDADDPRAPGLMSAARASASIADQRLLRVLDAETREGISYVVNEWGRGSSLDILLARSGPLSPPQAAWVTAQVAATLTRAHDLGYAHGRLNPENVLIDEAGGVRIIGFAVEAALYGLPEGSAAEDDTALAGILTACLTGTWPGTTPSAVPPTPVSGDHPLRPRQVRAGVPRALDDLCEAALNPASRGRHEGPILDARYLHDQLMAFVGEPQDLSRLPETPGLRAPEPTTSRRDDTGDGSGDGSEISPMERALDQAMAPAPPGTTDPLGEATQAGLPTFEEDDTWHRPRDVPAPPPPPLDPPAPKPLFADEPRVPRAEPYAPDPYAPEPQGIAPAGVPPRTPSTPPRNVDVTSSGSSGPGTAGHEFWPWQDAGSGGIRIASAAPLVLEEPPRSHWQRIAFGLVALLLVIAVVLAVRELTSSHGTGGGPTNTAPTSRTAGAIGPITDLTATDFDPFGDPPVENPDQVKYALDGKPSTAWQTVTYNAQLGDRPPALKSGVGLVLDLHGAYSLAAVTITVAGGDTGVSFYVTNIKPTTPNGLQPVARATITGPDQRVSLKNAEGRYVIVWLTSLPRYGGGYRGAVAEVSVTGSHVG